MTLPIDRSTLALAQGNQVPYQVAASAKNINFLKVVADTIDELNAKVNAHASSVLLPHTDESVSTAKIANEAVTTPKLAPQAVTSSKIANGAVGAAQLDPALMTDYGDIAVQAEFDRRGVSVLKYGVTGNGTTEDTAALKAFFLLGFKNVYFPDGTYKINLTEGDFLASYSGVDNIKIYGQNATILDAKTNYTFDGALTTVFKFSDCKNIDININFEGQTLAAPGTDLGYKGATFTRFITGCENIKVQGMVNHCRYGIQSGSYTTASEGYNKNFEIDLVTDFTGYPIALYLAESVNAKIRATNTHRASYLAGVSGGNIDVEFKDNYLAPVQVLVTDAKTGTGTSRGCNNLNVRAHDKGSTQYPTGGVFCAGIALSRVDPNTRFENVVFDVYVKSSDTVAAQVGGFYIASGATSYEPSYPFDWESSIYLTSIAVKGIIDKSAQTIADGTNGDLYISTSAAVGHSATVSNFRVDGLVIHSCALPTASVTFGLTNLIDIASFKNLIVTNSTVVVEGNLTTQLSFNGCNMGVLSIFGKYGMIDSKVTSITDTGSNGSFFNTFVHGSKVAIRRKKTELTMVGASPIVWANAIPAGAMVLDVQSIVTQVITGSTNISIGTTATFNLFAWGAPVTLNSATDATFGTAAALSPLRYAAATDLKVAGTGTFTAGKLEVYIWYIEFIRPTAV